MEFIIELTPATAKIIATVGEWIVDQARSQGGWGWDHHAAWNSIKANACHIAEAPQGSEQRLAAVEAADVEGIIKSALLEAGLL